jgi:hypothetical protein
MACFEQIDSCSHLAECAGPDVYFPVSSKTKAKTTTKTV